MLNLRSSHLFQRAKLAAQGNGIDGKIAMVATALTTGAAISKSDSKVVAATVAFGAGSALWFAGYTGVANGALAGAFWSMGHMIGSKSVAA